MTRSSSYLEKLLDRPVAWRVTLMSDRYIVMKLFLLDQYLSADILPEKHHYNKKIKNNRKSKYNDPLF
jgi:hypothetical protein